MASFIIDHTLVGPPLWEGYNRRCSRDTYQESYIIKCTSIRRYNDQTCQHATGKVCSRAATQSTTGRELQMYFTQLTAGNYRCMPSKQIVSGCIGSHTLHPAPYPLYHPSPHTLYHPTLYTLHPTPHTLHVVKKK